MCIWTYLVQYSALASEIKELSKQTLNMYCVPGSVVGRYWYIETNDIVFPLWRMSVCVGGEIDA